MAVPLKGPRDPDPLQPPKYCTSEATAGGALLYVAVYSSSQRTAISPGHNPKTRDLSSQSPHNPPICAPSLPTSHPFPFLGISVLIAKASPWGLMIVQDAFNEPTSALFLVPAPSPQSSESDPTVL
ncbi:hypothetical protein E5288_WYG011377 [Bos mutus]|uniref:Uncharacterized protein n=1 Tax=Bos mutus TaxID=72004 RepID=A0A6B0R5H9_9CETA|nr:hypothetical protein [Bos mutus]